MREVELPLVASITLLGIETHLPEPQAFITSLRCPAAKNLTCDDKSLGYLLNPAFPCLTHLFVNLTPRSNTPPYERVFSRIQPLSLTIYRPSRHDRHGLQSLVWMATHVRGMASSLKEMRFISIGEKPVMDTLLGQLNAARRTSSQTRQGDLFAKTLVITKVEPGKDVPWGKFFVQSQNRSLIPDRFRSVVDSRFAVGLNSFLYSVYRYYSPLSLYTNIERFVTMYTHDIHLYPPADCLFRSLKPPHCSRLWLHPTIMLTTEITQEYWESHSTVVKSHENR